MPITAIVIGLALIAVGGFSSFLIGRKAVREESFAGLTKTDWLFFLGGFAVAIGGIAVIANASGAS